MTTDGQEVAANTRASRFSSYSHVTAWVRESMIDESDTAISNVAWSLYEAQRQENLT